MKNIEFNKLWLQNSLMIHANLSLEAKYNFSAFMAWLANTSYILMNYILVQVYFNMCAFINSL